MSFEVWAIPNMDTPQRVKKHDTLPDAKKQAKYIERFGVKVSGILVPAKSKIVIK